MDNLIGGKRIDNINFNLPEVESPVMIVSNYMNPMLLIVEQLLYEQEITYANWESDPCDYDGLNRQIIALGVKHVFCDDFVNTNLINRHVITLRI